MILSTNTPIFLWTKVVNTTNFLVNKSLTKANFGITLEKKYSRTWLDLSYLRVFSCIIFVHITKKERKKLNSKSLKCLFVGYDNHSKAFWCYSPTTHKVKVSRDVHFDEENVFRTTNLREFHRAVDKESLGHGWMHIKVAHFLSHNAHFFRVPFLWTPITNNKTYQIENLKLIIH
jgi:hypothetical protein